RPADPGAADRPAGTGAALAQAPPDRRRPDRRGPAPAGAVRRRRLVGGCDVPGAGQDGVARRTRDDRATVGGAAGPGAGRAGDAASTVHVRATEDGRELARLTGLSGPADYLRFSPDGRFLAAHFAHDALPCRVWDWRSGRAVLELPARGLVGLSLDFHPDGRSV